MIEPTRTLRELADWLEGFGIRPWWVKDRPRKHG